MDYDRRFCALGLLCLWIKNTFIAHPTSVTHLNGSTFVHSINSFLYFIQPSGNKTTSFLQYIASCFVKKYLTCYTLIPSVKFCTIMVRHCTVSVMFFRRIRSNIICILQTIKMMGKETIFRLCLDLKHHF